MKPVDVFWEQAAEELADGFGQRRAMLLAAELKTDELVVLQALECPFKLVAGAGEGFLAINTEDEMSGE